MNLSGTLHNSPETSSSMILTMILLEDIRKGYMKTKNDCSAKKLEPLWISGNVTIRQQVGTSSSIYAPWFFWRGNNSQQFSGKNRHAIVAK